MKANLRTHIASCTRWNNAQWKGRGEAAIRIPLTQVKDVSVESARLIVRERMLDDFASPEDAVQRLPLVRDEWGYLARLGALDTWGIGVRCSIACARH